MPFIVTVQASPTSPQLLVSDAGGVTEVFLSREEATQLAYALVTSPPIYRVVELVGEEILPGNFPRVGDTSG